MKRIMSMVLIVAILMSATVVQVCAASKFKDVKDSDWFAEAVGKLNAMKIIDGLPGGSFNPKGEVTRAQFVKMLVQAMGYKKVDSVSFEDLKPFESSKPHWACVYIETALRNGIISKDEIGDNFYPDVPLARKDMGMMMFRALNLSASDGDNPFFDITELNGYFTKLYEEYLIRGVIEGGMRLYKPESLTTRAEAATIISRMLEYKADPEGFKARMAMEERFANGTQTAEDVVLKRQIEIEKAKADPNYIMEPIIRILNTKESMRPLSTDEKNLNWLFNQMAGYIVLDNFQDYEQYSSNIQYRLVAVDKGKELLNTKTQLTYPFISYDHRHEVRVDQWQLLKGSKPYDRNINGHIIAFISRDEEKSVNGKYVHVPDYNKVGEILNYKLYFKIGNNVKEYDIKFKVN